MTRKFSPVELLRIRQALNRREFEQRKNQREQKTETQNPSATWIGKDANDGRPVVRLSTGKEVKGVGIITNGALTPGQACNYRNGWVSGIPFRKRKAEGVKKATSTTGKIRWYYDGQVGGVSSTPFEIDSDLLPIVPIAFKNMGGSGWVLDHIDGFVYTPVFPLHVLTQDGPQSDILNGYALFNSALGGSNVYQILGEPGLSGSFTAKYYFNGKSFDSPKSSTSIGNISTTTWRSYLLPGIYYDSSIVSNGNPGSVQIVYDAMLPMRVSQNGEYAIAQKFALTIPGVTNFSVGLAGNRPLSFGTGRLDVGNFRIPGEAVFVDKNGIYPSGLQWDDVFQPVDSGIPVAFNFEQFGLSIDVQNDGSITTIDKTQFEGQNDKVQAVVHRYSRDFALLEEIVTAVYLPERSGSAFFSYNDEEGS